MQWSKSPKLLVILTVLGLVGPFQNCAQAPEIAEEDLASTSSQSSSVNHVPCASDSKTKTTKTEVIQFPSSMSSVCAFSATYPIKAGYAQVRVEQTLLFQLPKNAVICSASLDFQDDDVYFGGAFEMSLNARVMFASHTGLTSVLTADPVSKYLVYSWTPTVGKAISGSPYCADNGKGATCVVSPLATANHYAIHYTAIENYIRGALAAVASGNHVFRLTAIGDDDVLDCRHNGILGNVEVTYDVP